VIPFKADTLAHRYFPRKPDAPVAPIRMVGKKILRVLEKPRDPLTGQPFDIPAFWSCSHLSTSMQ